MYRYRDNHGVTYKSLQRAERAIPKLGTLVSVRGYRYRGRYQAIHEGVLVKGEKGTARFNGFCWGYGGEGPSGLVTLLTSLGIDRTKAESIAFTTKRDWTTIGVEWSVTL